MPGLIKTVPLLSHHALSPDRLAIVTVVSVNLLVIHSSTCIVSVGFSMVYTMGDDNQPTDSEAVSMSLGSITAVTTPGNIADGNEGIMEQWISLSFTWSGRSFTLDIAHSDRIFDLKAVLFSMTDVPPERQKILGLVKGRLPPDDGRIGDLGLISGKKFTLVGTPQGHELRDPNRMELLSDVINDLDVDFSANPAAAESHKNDQRNIRKIREASEKLKINLIHPLREGKRLLVLDIDYTILDTKPLTSGALPPSECARPRLHEFLTAIYPYYDICIWSQTSWIWLEAKLIELGMLGGSQSYQISFVLDKTPMFTVFSKRDGKSYTHHVKPLQVIWNHFPQFNAKNTIHVDDLGRNFALNPRQGLKISAFKDAHTPRALADRELDDLAKYLLHVASIEDMETLNHKDWKRVVRALPPN